MSKRNVKNVNEFKLILLGMSGVGKTSLVDRFINQQFTPQLESTIGMAFAVRTIDIDNKLIKLNIWDTAGQERYLSLAPIYLRNTHAAIVVYDIENETSFDRAQTWIRSLKAQDSPPKVIVLAANKSESMDQLAVETAVETADETVAQTTIEIAVQTTVETAVVQKYAYENDILFMKTSAKTGLNVNEMFLAVAERLSRTIPETQNKVEVVRIVFGETKRNPNCCNS